MAVDSLASEREMLLRFCTRYTGDPEVAEDLVQQTLLEAWRREQQLRDPQARRSWLFGIARNLCLMWGRRRGRELSRSAELGGIGWHDLEDRLAGDVDLEMDLERDDLAALLDRAMALLPPETREVLIRRYIEGSAQAEVAAQLGLTEGAVEARLHRGKLALRSILTNDLGNEALSHGLVRPGDVGWQETRVWCTGCGRRRFKGYLQADQGRLDMRCAECSLPGDYYVRAHMSDGLRGVKTFRPAVSRVLEDIHQTYRVQLVNGTFQCSRCGESIPIKRGAPPGLPAWCQNPEAIYLRCPGCGLYDGETWHSLTWSLPDVRRFWREHPKMRFVPEREIEVDGSVAVVTGFESMTDTARIEVVALRDSLRVVLVSGAPRARTV